MFYNKNFYKNNFYSKYFYSNFYSEMFYSKSPRCNKVALKEEKISTIWNKMAEEQMSLRPKVVVPLQRHDTQHNDAQYNVI